MNTVLREIVNKATSTITWRAKQQFSHPNQREASCCSLSSKTGRFFVAPSIHFYGPSWIDIDLELLTEIPCFRDFFALFWHQKVCHLSPKKRPKQRYAGCIYCPSPHEALSPGWRGHGMWYVGVSLYGGTPQNTQKWSFLVGNPMVVG